MSELESHEPVAVFVDLRLGQFAVTDSFLCKYVVYFGDLRVEIEPFLRVILNELAFLCLLSDNKVCAYLGKFSSLEVFEVASRKELSVLRHIVSVRLLAEYVLLL